MAKIYRQKFETFGAQKRKERYKMRKKVRGEKKFYKAPLTIKNSWRSM